MCVRLHQSIAAILVVQRQRVELQQAQRQQAAPDMPVGLQLGPGMLAVLQQRFVSDRMLVIDLRNLLQWFDCLMVER